MIKLQSENNSTAFDLSYINLNEEIKIKEDLDILKDYFLTTENARNLLFLLVESYNQDDANQAFNSYSFIKRLDIHDNTVRRIIKKLTLFNILKYLPIKDRIRRYIFNSSNPHIKDILIYLKENKDKWVYN